MICCEPGNVLSFGFGPNVAIGGNPLKKIRKEIHRGAKNVGQAASSLHDHVSQEVQRAGERTWGGIESMWEHIGEQGERIGKETYKGWQSGEPINYVVRAFRRNPEVFAAIGAAISIIPGWGTIVGGLIMAAAAVRIARNERKLRGAGVPGEESSEDAGESGGVGGMLDALNQMGMRLLAWIQANPLLAAGVAVAVYYAIRRWRA